MYNKLTIFELAVKYFQLAMKVGKNKRHPDYIQMINHRYMLWEALGIN